MPHLRRLRTALHLGVTRPPSLLAVTLLLGVVALVADRNAVSSVGSNLSIGFVELGRVVAATFGPRAGCGGPSLNTSQGHGLPATTLTAPTAAALTFMSQPRDRTADAQATTGVTPFLQAEAVDENGQRVPTFTDPFTITVNAPAGVTVPGSPYSQCSVEPGGVRCRRRDAAGNPYRQCVVGPGGVRSSSPDLGGRRQHLAGLIRIAAGLHPRRLPHDALAAFGLAAFVLAAEHCRWSAAQLGGAE